MREKLKNLIDENKYSISSVSRSLGISQATLSLWLNGKYTGKVDKINDAVNNFLLKEQERSKRVVIRFVETSIVKNVFEVAKVCHINCEIGVCYGQAGLGKTVAVKEYAKQNSDVILIEADPGYTPRILLMELHKRLGFTGYGNVYSMMLDIISKLENSGRLIIVDEAENLPYKALEVLRRIYDKAGVGILLVGMPRLIANLRGKKWQYAQLYSRVGIAKMLEPIKLSDAKEIIETILPECHLFKTFHEKANGNTRVLNKLILRAINSASLNEGRLSKEIIEHTAKVLMV